MYTRKHHKEDISGWEITRQLGGETLNGKIHFPLMKKGEIFIRCRGQKNGSRGGTGHIYVGMVLGGP
jgi:hypothetical protein